MTVSSVLFLLEIYGWVGAATALIFLLFGIDRIDASARGSYAFRPILIPGIIVVWPLVLYRWISLERAGEE